MPCVYILYSPKSGKKYVGSTHESTPTERLLAHNAGKAKSTKFGKPWIVIYEECAIDYTSARKRELFLKTGAGRRWVQETVRKHT
jgi:putative endonuclease